jgi:ESF2/ABP1 family protein
MTDFPEDNENDYSYDILGDNYLNADENPIQETDIEAYKEKIRRSGIVYISYIPENMKVLDIKEKFEKYGVTRIYFVPDKHQKTKKYLKYKEGWVEFKDKLMAKLCEYELNGKMIGGKKRHNPFREEIWTIKYLHKFKWHHLVEKLGFNRKMREHRIKAEVNQSKRETNFIMEKFLQSKIINNLNKKRVK